MFKNKRLNRLSPKKQENSEFGDFGDVDSATLHTYKKVWTPLLASGNDAGKLKLLADMAYIANAWKRDDIDAWLVRHITPLAHSLHDWSGVDVKRATLLVELCARAGKEDTWRLIVADNLGPTN